MAKAYCTFGIEREQDCDFTPRWMLCPSSAALPENAPGQGGSSEGTVAHSLAADADALAPDDLETVPPPFARPSRRVADRIDGYDRDDLGESPDY